MTTLPEDYVCICGHEADQHNDPLGYCEAKECKCVVYRNQFDEDEETDSDFDGEELDFEEDG